MSLSNYTCKNTILIVSCIYRAPGSDVDILCENLDQLLIYANRSKTKFVCNDFDIELLKQETHTPEQSGF